MDDVLKTNMNLKIRNKSMKFHSIEPVLNRYILKCQKLEDSRFAKSLAKEFRIGLKVTSGGSLEITSIRPDQDNIDAFTLNFRFFIQDNEPTSIRNLKDIFDSKFVTSEEKKNFTDMRKKIEKYLTSKSNLKIFEKNITCGELMNIFIFGDLSHGNYKDKTDKFESWMKREDVREFFWFKFCEIVYSMLEAIRYIRDLISVIIIRHKKT